MKATVLDEQTVGMSAILTAPHRALGVSFQGVVHPVLSEEAEVVEALANPRRTE